ncbi:hypothetical protein FS837_012689 [Tulasnella sp. UAMH 9824]|nr:hypothetical protein FS837_012689 [Tulasnella sp. UAMH 9824]
MQNDKHSLTDTSHALGSDYNGSHSKILLSANMTHRLEKLVRWRINPSLIKFSEGGGQSKGGYGTVSRALLRSSVNGTEDKHMESNTAGATSGNHISELEGNNESGKAEVNEEREDESAAEGERQTQGSDDKTPVVGRLVTTMCFSFERRVF